MIKKHWYVLRKSIFPYTDFRPMLRVVKNNCKCNGLIGCEVGVNKGYNLKSIFKNLNIRYMYAIDIDLSNCIFKNKHIVFIEDNSLKAVNRIKDGELDFCYIDTSHRYIDTKKEIKAYLPKIKDGGFIGGHNFDQKGVCRAVFECFDYDKIIDGIDWCVKIKSKKSGLK